MSGGWNVADSANPDRKYSPMDVNEFPPEFGPFDTREEAEAFAEMRPAYYVVPPKGKAVHYCGNPTLRREPTLCGLTRYDNGKVEVDLSTTTTYGADVTCHECARILVEG